MNYYIINNASRAAAYGIGTYVRELTKILINNPNICLYHIDLYSEVKEFTINKDELGVTHYQIPLGNSQIETEMYCRTAAYLLFPYLPHEEMSIYHFNYYQHYALALALKAKNLNNRIFLTVHYWNWCFELDGNLKKFREIIKNENTDEKNNFIRYEYLQNKSFMRFADSIIVLSNFAKNVLNIDYNIELNKIYLIHNGLEDLDKDKINEITDSEQRIIYVGRLDRIKGVKYLLEAFREVVQTHKNAKLTIVGDGDYNECLKLCKGLWDKITFTGKISQEELLEQYNNTMIGVLPSFHEQCSYSAIEFMRHGIPFVATNSTGLNEMLDIIPELKVNIDEDNFVQRHFVQELSEKIIFLLDNINIRRDCAKRVRKQYEISYSKKMLIHHMNNLISHEMSDKSLIVSNDFLQDMDNYMISLIHIKPDIDIEFYGISGIGIYLWWRVCNMDEIEEEAMIYKIKEYLIYFIDWLYEVITENSIQRCCKELDFTLRSMQEANFYQVRIGELVEVLHCLPTKEAKELAPQKNEIIENTLQMLITKI
ncbi:MAG: glycosyltransferase [Bacteroidaceae bacterium]|nr:glycosyltransferase [Bacteroidaceae bacterium]